MENAINFRTLKAEEIDCRISQIASNWLTLLLYKDARCDMNILDETVGILNWKREHRRENANCVVSIYDSEKQEWVSKEDTGTESFSESEKGLASDSFKRACVNWGIGRELYTAPSIFITPRNDMVKRGKETEFYDKGNGKFETKTNFYVEFIDYDENKNIKDLIIRDNKNNIRFSKLTKETEKSLGKNLMKMKQLIESKESKDDSFNRENLYKYYGVESDLQLTCKQVIEVINMLNKKENEVK